jgi:hypothetical protein
VLLKGDVLEIWGEGVDRVIVRRRPVPAAAARELEVQAFSDLGPK